VGGVTESVLEFAHRCARVLREVNGGACKIILASNLPPSAPEVGAQFELVSTKQRAEMDGAAELDAYLANYYRLTGRI
jgi:hypothetical protein